MAFLGFSERGGRIAFTTAARNSALLTGLPPMCGTARLKSRAIHSGFSSSTLAKVLFEVPFKALFLTVIGVSHRDDAPRAFTQRPHYAHQAITQHSECPYARLAVIMADAPPNESLFHEDPSTTFQDQPPVPNGNYPRRPCLR